MADLKSLNGGRKRAWPKADELRPMIAGAIRAFRDALKNDSMDCFLMMVNDNTIIIIVTVIFQGFSVQSPDIFGIME